MRLGIGVGKRNLIDTCRKDIKTKETRLCIWMKDTDLIKHNYL